MNSTKSKPTLSRREHEILGLIIVGLTSKEIAAKLYVDIQTVNTHRKRMMKKAKANNIYGVIFYSITNNLIDLEFVKSFGQLAVN